ncbi:MAG: type VI secretion system contractile sheath large subunit [Steroidobacteraceae bacterium]|jgi:type VI secretion system protein ImpC
MATKTETAAAQATTTETSLLDQAISATKQTEPEQAQLLLKTLTEEALAGTLTFSKNLTVTFNKAIALLDKKLSEQTSAIMHHPDFLKLEGSWRGLQYFVKNTLTDSMLKIKLLNASKTEIGKDLAKATDFDQSDTFKRIYTSEFGTLGGEPFGALIGDYEFTNQSSDVEFLTSMSSIAAGAFTPFISSTNSKMFGLSDFRDLAKPQDLKRNFESQEYARWRSFRDRDEAAFVTLTMPRVLARVPYGKATNAIEEFAFEEAPKDAKGNEKPLEHEEYCWMNAAYVLGARLTDAFAKNGWCTAIRGAENGGKVEGLPSHVFKSDDGDTDQKCPTEIGIDERREYELSECGFLSLVHSKNSDFAVFIGSQTTKKPAKYSTPDATENAQIASRLPYVMATARFAHFLKVMGRDKIGSFMEVDDCGQWLNNWIQNYVNSSPTASAESKARYPLREARVEVKAIPGKAGCYNAVAYLRPWLQMEELTASLRLVANIPPKQS